MFRLINLDTNKAYSSQTEGTAGHAWVDIDSPLADTTTTAGTLQALADYFKWRGAYRNLKVKRVVEQNASDEI